MFKVYGLNEIRLKNMFWSYNLKLIIVINIIFLTCEITGIYVRDFENMLF